MKKTAAVTEVRSGFLEEQQRIVHAILSFTESLTLCELSTICMATLKPPLNDFTQFKNENEGFMYKYVVMFGQTFLLAYIKTKLLSIKNKFIVCVL